MKSIFASGLLATFALACALGCAGKVEGGPLAAGARADAADVPDAATTPEPPSDPCETCAHIEAVCPADPSRPVWESFGYLCSHACRNWDAKTTACVVSTTDCNGVLVCTGG